MDLIFKIVFGCLCALMLACFVGIFFNVLYEDKCRQQGGVPVKGVCLKAETIKVVY